jgi:hypothetical protein
MNLPRDGNAAPFLLPSGTGYPATEMAVDGLHEMLDSYF